MGQTLVIVYLSHSFSGFQQSNRDPTMALVRACPAFDFARRRAGMRVQALNAVVVAKLRENSVIASQCKVSVSFKHFPQYLAISYCELLAPPP